MTVGERKARAAEIVARLDAAADASSVVMVEWPWGAETPDRFPLDAVRSKWLRGKAEVSLSVDVVSGAVEISFASERLAPAAAIDLGIALTEVGRIAGVVAS